MSEWPEPFRPFATPKYNCLDRVANRHLRHRLESVLVAREDLVNGDDNGLRAWFLGHDFVLTPLYAPMIGHMPPFVIG